MICVLAGGVGAAKLLSGLQAADLDEEIVAIVNTGDDDTFYGLHVSPDLDSVTYALAGISNEALGWGVKDETYEALSMAKHLGDDAWFTLGDKDLGTHLYRTRRLQEGASLTEVTEEIRQAHGISIALLPMSDDPVRTMLSVAMGTAADPDATMTMRFQEYFVKHRHALEVRGVAYKGAQTAKLHEGLLDHLTNARKIIIAPSNPILSIDPILSISAIRQAITQRRNDVISVSPIINDKALKGPADNILRTMLGDSSVVTVAKHYQDIASRIVIDQADLSRCGEISDIGVEPIVTKTVMKTTADKITLGRFLVELD